ncbi:MAG: hypothetical protein KDC02_17080 [Flavobacteriales bacterium]|nr:hypothetical protein [Flavobacteriales bacterium]
MERDYTTALTAEELAQRLDGVKAPTWIVWPGQLAATRRASLVGDQLRIRAILHQAIGDLDIQGPRIRIRLRYSLLWWTLVQGTVLIGMISFLALSLVLSDQVRFNGETVEDSWVKLALSLLVVMMGVVPNWLFLLFMRRSFERGIVSLLELERVQNS